MHHAGTQTAGDERKMGVGVARFDGALGGVEIVAALQAVVGVSGAFGKSARNASTYPGMCWALSRAARLRSRKPAVV
jgi:hypothetical protein